MTCSIGGDIGGDIVEEFDREGLRLLDIEEGDEIDIWGELDRKTAVEAAASLEVLGETVEDDFVPPDNL